LHQIIFSLENALCVQAELEEQYKQVLENHQELKNLIGDFVAAALVEKPEDVFVFAKDFFTMNGPGPTETPPTRPLIVCGPSGVGKSVILKKVFAEFPDRFGFSVSHTTRKPREGEKDGVDYHFAEKEEMQKDIDLGLFLEHAEVHGNLYGTSVMAVKSVLDSGRNCVLDVDVQGVESLRKAFSGGNDKVQFGSPFCVFITPPSIDTLEERLRGRGSETEETLQKRLNTAKKELQILEQKPHLFDRVLVNDDLDKVIEKFTAILREMAYV